MNRRRFLAGLGTLGTATLAGCTGFDLERGAGGDDGESTTRTSAGNVPPVLEDRPPEPYLPTHVEGMAMAGEQTDGDYACMLTFTFPHRFWLVTGTNTRKVVVERDDTVHLMPVIWHTEAGFVPPDISPQIEITRNGDTVADFAPWPMLSQPMGFHYGDNVALPDPGTYTVTVTAGSPSGRRTGGLEPNDPLAFEFEWEYRESALQDVMYRDIPSDQEGQPGAVDPMDMLTVPMTQAPEPGSLPGTTTDLGESNGAVFHATLIEDASDYGGSSDESYLAVSPRTTYNRYVLPMMSLSATLETDSSTVHAGPLSDAIDPELGYHYGTIVNTMDSTAELGLTVDAPPQVSRHEGYETAFFDIPSLEETF